MSETLLALTSLTPPPISVALLVAVAVLLIGTDPVLGRRQYRAFLAELAADPGATQDVQVRFYQTWTRQGWLWAAGTLVLVVVLPGVGLTDLGLRWPSLGGLDGLSRSFVIGILSGLVGAVVVTVVATRIPARRRPPATGVVTAPAVLAMLPAGPRARRGWAGLAVMAGITEEVTYRGLVVLVLATVLGGAGPVIVVLAAGALFGAAHWYQGRAGMLATGALGCVLAGLYLATGSLLIPMVLHLALDLRPLLTPAPPTQPTAPQPTPPSTPPPGAPASRAPQQPTAGPS